MSLLNDNSWYKRAIRSVTCDRGDDRTWMTTQGRRKYDGALTDRMTEEDKDLIVGYWGNKSDFYKKICFCSNGLHGFDT